MSVEEIKAIVRRFVDEPWNKGNVDVIDELCSPEYTLRYGTESIVRSRDDLKKGALDNRAISTNFKATIEEIIVEGNRVAYEWKMSRTDEQGKLKTTVGITILKIKDGKIIEDYFLADDVKPDQTPS